MSPPIDIDGSEIQEATIDGQDVSEITIDGQQAADLIGIPDSVVAHFDATELSGFNDGNTVSTWPDEANGHDATSSGAPVYRASGINGNPAVEFDGTNDSYDAPVGVTSQPYTFISCVQTPGGSGIDAIVGTRSSPLTILEIDHDKSDFQFSAGALVRGSSNTTTVNVVSARFDGSNSAIREDGTETGAGNAGLNDIDALNIGVSAVRSSRLWNGRIGLVEMHDVALSDSELAVREATIANQWGLTL